MDVTCFTSNSHRALTVIPLLLGIETARNIARVRNMHRWGWQRIPQIMPGPG
jgi:hypothetical protein